MSAASSNDALPRAPTLKLASGREMPVVGFGTWRTQPGEASASVYTALRAGYRHIDCARIYANEKEVGEGIAKAIAEGIVKREDLFITTKVWNNCHTRDLAIQSIRDAAADLGVKTIDLVLQHWPVHFVHDPAKGPIPRDEKEMVINETDPTKASTRACWEGLEQLVKDGLVRDIGVSNFSEAQIDEVWEYATIKPAVNQVELHPYFPQDSMLAYAKRRNMLVVHYSPLGNLRADDKEQETPLKDPVVLRLAEKHHKSPAQIVLRWGLQHGHVVLPKSVTPSRIRENFALFDFALSDEEMAAMAELGKKQRRFVNPTFNVNGSNVFP